VLVFEDFPANKAEELMQLAGSGSSATPPQNKAAPAAAAAAAATEEEKPAAANPPAALPDMPIARKASLQRFLQKRKHR
jgi:jasmonate ZIM domain-containing protein